MRRRTFDLIASLGGLVLAVVLLVLGVLFQQNANFAHDNDEEQLTQQQVVLALLGLWHHRRTPVEAQL